MANKRRKGYTPLLGCNKGVGEPQLSVRFYPQNAYPARFQERIKVSLTPSRRWCQSSCSSMSDTFYPGPSSDLIQNWLNYGRGRSSVNTTPFSRPGLDWTRGLPPSLMRSGHFMQSRLRTEPHSSIRPSSATLLTLFQDPVPNQFIMGPMSYITKLLLNWLVWGNSSNLLADFPANSQCI
jgi:hypothetical protein